ncbi:MAG TPA: hypothetical protein PK246_08275 [Saprospiraceae bacterium]|nr:hypothetical protein [Saprospiraceae bacterium]
MLLVSMPKINKSSLQKIETLLKEQDYTIRYEKGNFNSGYCLVNHKKMVVINKFYDLEARINVCLDLLSLIEIDEKKFSPTSKSFFKSIILEQEQAVTA